MTMLIGSDGSATFPDGYAASNPSVGPIPPVSTLW